MNSLYRQDCQLRIMPMLNSAKRSKLIHKSLAIGKWRLRGHILEPSRQALESFAENEAKSLEENPFIEIHLYTADATDSAKTSSYTVRKARKAHIQSLEGPLAKMFSLPFKEATESKISLMEDLATYRVLEYLMYAKPIDLIEVPHDFIYVADRLMLDFMVNAILIHAEKTIQTPLMRTRNATKQFMDTETFLKMYLPVLDNAIVTTRFKRHYALRFVREYEERDGEAKERLYEPSSTPGDSRNKSRLVDPWVVLAKCNMLSDIAWYFSNITKNEIFMIEKYVSQIFRVEHHLSNAEIATIFDNFRWDSPAFRRYFLNYTNSGNWSQRVCDMMHARMAEMGETISWAECQAVGIFDWIGCRRILSVDEEHVVPCFDTEVPISTDYSFDALIGVGWIKDSLDDKVVLRVSFHGNDYPFPPGVELYQVRVTVRAFEKFCSCHLKDSIEGRRYEGIFLDSGILDMETAIERSIVLPLMNPSDRQRWIATHENDCTISIVVTFTYGPKGDVKEGYDIAAETEEEADNEELFA